MLKVMLQKLWHKKWMGFSLLIGITLLIAGAVSFPMYQNAAYDRMLQDEFDQSLAQSGSWPAMNILTVTSKKERGGTTISRMEELMTQIHGQLGVTERQILYYYTLTVSDAVSEMHRDDVEVFNLRISCMGDLDEHASLISGEMYSEEGVDSEGCLEAVISEAGMVETGLLLGETVEFSYLKDPEGNPIRLKIVGVFEEADPREDYWRIGPENLHNNCMIREELFRKYFTGEQAVNFTINCSYFPMWDYRDLKSGDVERLMEQTRYYIEESPYRSTFSDPPYLPILEGYLRKQARIDAALFLLQVPVWILLGAFLFMISAQMYDMERNEISVMKSRGSSGLQIFRLYLYQSIFLTLLGALAGLPLGKLFARALGAAGSFLEFRSGRVLPVVYTKDAFLFGLIAMAVCILMITLPALKHSRLSIVSLKQQKAARKRSWWEICFLDVILLGLSLYEYYVFSGKQAEIEANAFLGEPMEPLLYLSSSLFIVGLGLFLLRLQPLLVGLIYWIGKKFWGPAAYISFMENQKNGRKQQFIMLFLILSISLGIFHSTTARTILQNARENTAYLDGADRIVKEIWRNNAGTSFEGEVTELQYYEPDFNKYRSLPDAESYTKVIYDEKGYLYGGEHSGLETAVCGIQTKQFGENTVMPGGLLDKHYYEYLNELALEPKGVLLSSNFRDLLGFKAGDAIVFYNSDRMRMDGVILDFVDYWPGYAPSSMSLNPDGTVAVTPKYLIIANIASLNQRWGAVPYEVWIKNGDGAAEAAAGADIAAGDDAVAGADADAGIDAAAGADAAVGTDAVEGTTAAVGVDAAAGADTAAETGTAATFSEWLEEEEVRLAKYVDRQADLDAVTEDPLLQGTNGILTMGFLMTMILCATGYLIYWILSIRSREMIFGILRANGMHRGEIFHILINEQLFCGGFAVLAGTLIGLLSSRMFVPILQTAYAASDQVLPLRLITQRQDMVRLYGVIGGVLFLCLLVLVVLVRKLDVAKALKLGEE